VAPPTAACVFCAIAAQQAEASIVFEDDVTMAFMDLRQMSSGHVLVVPKTHVPDIFSIDDVTGAAVMRTVVRVARAVRDALHPDGLNIWQSNGAAAGQEVPHVHFHVLPRAHDDEMLRVYPRRPDYPPRAELDATAATIAKRIE
jgi:histidine triad (HIT) family protein